MNPRRSDRSVNYLVLYNPFSVIVILFIIALDVLFNLVNTVNSVMSVPIT